jgi:hypothetical protein
MNELNNLEKQILIALVDRFARELVAKLNPEPVVKKEEPKNEQNDNKPVTN